VTKTAHLSLMRETPSLIERIVQCWHCCCVRFIYTKKTDE